MSPIESGPDEEFTSFEKVVVGVVAGFLAALLIEVMLIIGFTFYRITIDLYRTDPALFVRALNSYGSTFLNGTVLGTGGALAALRYMPKLITWARTNGITAPRDDSSSA
jgi:hypothetical protein